MVGPARCLQRLALVASLLGGFLVSRPACAQVKVTIRVEGEDLNEAAQRLVSELESEGYAVEIANDGGPSPCEVNGPGAGAVTRDTRAWVVLRASPSGDDSVVASICYLGALPLVQQASSSAPSSAPRQLAVTTAEALNGLRSRLPLLVGEAPPPVQREPPASGSVPPARSARLSNSTGVGMGLVRHLPDYPVALGALLRASLGIGAWVSLGFDGFVPVGGAELTSSQVTATVRTAWLRIGPRLGSEAGDFHLAGALLGGPVITWATATAVPPRVGTVDVSLGALVSLAALVEYPARTPFYAFASGSASAILPRSRVAMGEGEPRPRGFWPVEGSFGFGARWGAAY